MFSLSLFLIIQQFHNENKQTKKMIENCHHQFDCLTFWNQKRENPPNYVGCMCIFRFWRMKRKTKINRKKIDYKKNQFWIRLNDCPKKIISLGNDNDDEHLKMMKL